jgi:hypothetical protein
MKTANLFQSVWYICPQCGVENTVCCTDPLFNKGFKCSGCQSTWTCDGLFTLCYDGTPVPPKDKMAVAGIWYCECGRKNLILPRTEKIVKYSDSDRCCIEYVEIPKYGLCEDCFAEYDLTTSEEK